MEDNKNTAPTQLNIELGEDMAEGVYSNFAIITHSQTEFVLDFVRIMPNVPKAKVKARIVLTPEHTKRLAQAILDNLHSYEAQFGSISSPDQAPIPPMSFMPPVAQA